MYIEYPIAQPECQMFSQLLPQQQQLKRTYFKKTEANRSGKVDLV